MKNDEHEFDVKSAARELKISEMTVRRLLAARQLGHFRRGCGGGRFVIRQRDIDTYRAARTFERLAA
jgi:excisionase family DNA binding protein